MATESAMRAGRRKFWIIHRPKYVVPKSFIAALSATGEVPVVDTVVYVARSSEEM